MRESLYIIGAGGHSKVLEDICKLNNFEIKGVIEEDSTYMENASKDELLVNGIGGVKNTVVRRKVFEKYKEAGFGFKTLVHPGSIVSSNVIMGEGVQIFAGAIVQPGVELGSNVVINTGVSIDHDCKIENHVHIAPGTVLSGEIKIGEGTFVGMGARVIQGITIGKNCLIAAGAVVVKDVQDGSTVMGIPAKEVKCNGI